jgi:hypothetical protein
MENLNVDLLLTTFARKVADIVLEEISHGAFVKGPRLLDVERAAAYLGRTEEAMNHMIAAGKVSTVRIDRRVFLDIRELDALIENHKIR